MTGEEQAKLSHLLACGVPEREAEYVAAGVPDRPAIAAVRDFSRSPKTFCLMLGAAGSGKTVAAAEALLNVRIAWEENGTKKWVYSPSEAKFLLATNLARLSFFESEALKKLGRAERIPWLVIDDLGGELMTEGWKSNLTELILERHSARRKTLITTNLSAEAFKERYEERIISRIRGDGVVIAFGADDLRRGAA